MEDLVDEVGAAPPNHRMKLESESRNVRSLWRQFGDVRISEAPRNLSIELVLCGFLANTLTLNADFLRDCRPSRPYYVTRTCEDYLGAASHMVLSPGSVITSWITASHMVLSQGPVKTACVTANHMVSSPGSLITSWTIPD
ncbi:hypothetical protein RRG08_061954 [Elysia crispata]|uniref:Uncharacterized protein n=1 Tax=Elysia crispata TaxID=231223 RepID=A0AAE0ZK62_9GAST|nr:hypothetical protein RRG08_061954 [Elysia crispata]